MQSDIMFLYSEYMYNVYVKYISPFVRFPYVFSYVTYLGVNVCSCVTQFTTTSRLTLFIVIYVAFRCCPVIDKLQSVLHDRQHLEV